MTPVDAASAISAGEKFATQFGFPALLVVVLLLGIWWLLKRQDARLEAKDQAHAAERAEDRKEREADRKAHVEAFQGLTGVLLEIKASIARDHEARREAVATVVERIERAQERLMDQRVVRTGT